MPKHNITLFDLKKQLDLLYSRVNEIAIKSQNFYDPLPLIRSNDKGERIYKYQNAYYNNLKTLYEAVTYQTPNYTKQLKTFKEMATNPNRTSEL